MAFKFNPFTGNLDIVNSTIIATSDPASSSEGQWLINTTSNELKIYYSGAWYVIYSFGAPVANLLLLEDGFVLLMENGDNFRLE